jgi:hypothetical protein
MSISKFFCTACAATLVLSSFFTVSHAQMLDSIAPSSLALAPPALTQAAPSQAAQSVPQVPEMVPDASGTGFKIARAVENFSELTLKGSDLHPVAPLLGSREQTPDFVRELWQLRWRPNDPIDLWVILPRGVKNPPVVLYLYGYPTDTERFKNAAYCKRIVQSGAAAIGFVSAMTGQRTDFRPFKETFITEMPEALASSVHDIPMILDYLQTRDDLDMNRVGIFGQGSGGTIATLAASVEPRLKTVDLLDPWGDWPDWFATAPNVPEKDRANYLKPEFEKRLEPLDPVRYLQQLKSQSIRIQFVTGEGYPKQAADRIVAAAPASANVVRFTTSKQMYDENSGGRLFEWMAAQLGAHPTPPEQSNPATAAVTPTKSKP